MADTYGVIGVKKIVGWIASAIMALGLVLSCVIYVAFTQRQQELAGRKSVTLEELAQVTERMLPRVAGRVLETPETERASQSSGQKDKSVSPPQSKRLDGTPSAETLARRFGRPETESAIVIGGAKVIESALRTFGRDDAARDWAWESGRQLMSAGEWDAARGYFYALLDTPAPSARYRDACARLAWLEHDPEVAAHLLEMSCEDNYGWGAEWVRRNKPAGKAPGASAYFFSLDRLLLNAVELCKATGSDALANDYLERLRALSPEMARQFDAAGQVDGR